MKALPGLLQLSLQGLSYKLASSSTGCGSLPCCRSHPDCQWLGHGCSDLHHTPAVPHGMVSLNSR